MKYIRQLFVILLFSFLGEGLKSLLPLPVPSGIYGLVLLFLALQLHIIKPEAVAETGKFLVEVMPLMFIPAGAGLIDSWESLKAGLCSGGGHSDGVSRCGHGCIGTCGAVCHPQEKEDGRERQMRTFFEESVFLACLSVYFSMKSVWC